MTDNKWKAKAKQIEDAHDVIMSGGFIDGGNPCKDIKLPKAEEVGINPQAIIDMTKQFQLGQIQQFFPKGQIEKLIDIDLLEKETLVFDLETSAEAQAQVEHERVVALQAKYGTNFEPAPLDTKDSAGNTVIGSWKQNKEPEYRRRWVGTKYVYERVDTE